MAMVIEPCFYWKAIMDRSIKQEQSSNKDLIILRSIALNLIEDCYQSKPINESINNFLTRVSLLRDKVSSKC